MPLAAAGGKADASDGQAAAGRGRGGADGWNDRAYPSPGPRPADQILHKAFRKKTSTTGH